MSSEAEYYRIFQFVYGLTGGIACGKSTVSEFLKKHDCIVVDADQVSRDVMQPGHRAFDEVIEAFGEEFLQEDGTLDRKALGNHVFGDEDERRRLESIVQSHILVASEKALWRAVRSTEHPVFYESAVIFEMGMQDEFKGIVTVACEEETQISRLMARNNLTREQALNRINAQFDLETKKSESDWTIENEGDLESLEAGVVGLLKAIAREES